MRKRSASDFSPTTEFWRGRRVFLTGHTGFKGSWLALWLTELGAQVRGYALPPDTEPAMFTRLGLAQICDDLLGELLDEQHLARSLVEFQPDTVVHMAAQSLVRRSIREPVRTFAINVQGTVNLLEACRRSSTVRAVVVVTSDKCYENQGTPWGCRENDPLGGASPYAASKACAEIVTAAYRETYFPPALMDRHHRAVATARSGNVFGGGDWSEDRLLPDAARAFVQERPVGLRNPRAVRPWQFVMEPLCGYLMLARALHEDPVRFAQAWNFGPRADQLLTVTDVAEAFADAWGPPARCEPAPEIDPPPEDAMLLIAPGLANRLLGWTPRLDFEEAVAATARWYRAFYRGDDMLAVTRGQIAGFAAGSGAAL